MSNVVFSCHRCGSRIPLAVGEKVERKDDCDDCGASLRCCRNCRFFDTSRSGQCSESQAELVSDKEKSNFCDYYEPRTAIDLVGKKSGQHDAKKAFDDLFR